MKFSVSRMVHDMPVISNAECNDVYGIVGDGIVCIDTTGGKSSCNVSTLYLTLVMMRGGTLCPPKVFLFFYQKSLPLTKP